MNDGGITSFRKSSHNKSGISLHSLLSPFAQSLSYNPVSTIFPPSNTTTTSASRKVEARCVTSNNARLFLASSTVPSPPLRRHAATASATAVSPSTSIEDVGSSKIKRHGSQRSALARAILCLCPPDNLHPSRPTLNSSLPSRFCTNVSAFEARKASQTRDSVAATSDDSGSPYVTFAIIESSKRAGC
mmetsp:Transcript_21271/g.30818  ORF Transcript_21271/g.30818 Transcript_21271/m.30818 type:complete len:188 (-) Transcript_21271:1020-1583(-)